MTANKNLLVELLVEELPPKSLKKLGEVFSQTLLRSLIDRNLTNGSAVTIPYASPRRLAVHISNVAATAPDKELTEKLMPVSIAIGPGGKSTDALRKRLAKIGRERLADLWPATEDGPDRLFVQSDGKDHWTCQTP